MSLSQKQYGPVAGYAARGYLGQYLVVYPELGLVGVRMVVADESYDNATDGFDNFEERVRALRKR